MRRILMLLLGIKPVEEIRPLEFGPNGLERIHMEALNRLQHLHSLGCHYRDQMEAAAEECCLLLGIDPELDTSEAHWAQDIVWNGMDPSVVIRIIDENRRIDHHVDL